MSLSYMNVTLLARYNPLVFDVWKPCPNAGWEPSTTDAQLPEPLQNVFHLTTTNTLATDRSVAAPCLPQIKSSASPRSTQRPPLFPTPSLFLPSFPFLFFSDSFSALPSAFRDAAQQAPCLRLRRSCGWSRHPWGQYPYYRACRHKYERQRNHHAASLGLPNRLLLWLLRLE